MCDLFWEAFLNLAAKVQYPPYRAASGDVSLGAAALSTNSLVLLDFFPEM